MLPTGISASASAPYTCGSAGGRSPRSGGIAACNWSFVPPSPEFNFVSAGGPSCSSTAPCAASATCGYSLPGGSPRHFSRVCGSSAWGFWSAGSICGYDTNDPLMACNTSLPVPNSGLKLNNLFGCTQGASTCCSPFLAPVYDPAACAPALDSSVMLPALAGHELLRLRQLAVDVASNNSAMQRS